ncbi:unnamed protein product [Paramecium sonneborni]|uniref:Uncharacterized protein n=1 Tax=Paramecium sonneborni TaxID=65129 RepID=A0A8S1R1G6_9CILI|nr:unnamed protein product [Paramecium sonneborni]CAD8130434.1 unnamed protein product [Paramecium sonneborni]
MVKKITSGGQRQTIGLILNRKEVEEQKWECLKLYQGNNHQRDL